MTVPGPVLPQSTDVTHPQMLREWLLADRPEQLQRQPGPHARERTPEQKQHSWWRVMCLTGVDYFSSLGYQPGIAVLAAGAVSPIATLVLVLVTLLGAMPVYRRVAQESPHGEGSIAMLEKLLPSWLGKIFVLVLLGFACTAFLITMTLSASDATAHVLENPFVPEALKGHPIWPTLVLLALLAAVFLRGFSEAIGIAVGLVALYLVLNAVVIVVAFAQVLTRPDVVPSWRADLLTQHGSPWGVLVVALLVFPKLALGLSGFETGVAVLPQISGKGADDKERLADRIRGGRRLLATAAVIMSGFLITSSIVVTLLVPVRLLAAGGPANGRALAYLAHDLLGNVFGTVYDISTIAILWFAGASAMAGLLNLIPRYLPRYGMAPQWARANRPMVLVIFVVAVVLTVYFGANVDEQSGAYATGVLVLITSASIAVTLSARRHHQRGLTVVFAVVAVVLAYTLVANLVERPDGLPIAGSFILAILVVSLLSRTRRAFELRASEITFDDEADRLIRGAIHDGLLRVIPNEPDAQDGAEYDDKTALTRRQCHLPEAHPVIFLEVTVGDSSEFETAVHVVGHDVDGHRVLRVHSAAIANTIAAVLLEIRDRYDVTPHVYFEWSEGNPLAHIVRFLFLGVGEVAPVTREVLREAEPDATRRPPVHVG